LVWKGLELEGENVIGRDPHVTVHVDAASVCRRHARITVREISATLEDLGSKNGTFPGGTRLTGPACLRDGDSARSGSVMTTFRIWSPDLTTKTAHAG
jgi:pSer/pThr/pTyr-binding forkhead associated (FHA) protein